MSCLPYKFCKRAYAPQEDRACRRMLKNFFMVLTSTRETRGNGSRLSDGKGRQGPEQDADEGATRFPGALPQAIQLRPFGAGIEPRRGGIV